ncbi:MAG TPA: hypothetical protein VG943_05355 [Caulobacterales bacterium]|nr:hypothetical protein [Caulobacterales bacterium]
MRPLPFANAVCAICWMDRGQIVMMGDPDTVIPAYLRGIQRPNAEPDRRITGLG